MATVLAHLEAILVAVNPILAVRMSFLVASATVLIVYAVPAFRNRFLSYGSRSVSQSSVAKAATQESTPDVGQSVGGQRTAFELLLDTVALWQVPHGYFTHFYFLSVCASAFWAQQCIMRGAIMTSIVKAASVHSRANAMSKPQILLLWILMSTQGLRRLYETLVFRTASTSKMWVGHYVMGLAFYAGMSVAIWIEGARGLIETSSPSLLDSTGLKQILRISNAAALILFVQASTGQHQAHRHLYELRSGVASKKDGSAKSTYALPTHPLFRTTLTPHYASECLIYFALCVIGAPVGWVCNPTILCALVFVVINLGVTADGTRSWYAQKFGEDAVKGKARMIPKVW